jgi:pimeloyl-ACP methyl ester carboxylesterase
MPLIIGAQVRWDEVGGRRVRSLVAGARQPGRPDVVIVPGLGMVGYLTGALLACGVWTRTFLLDVPGFGHRRSRPGGADLESTAALAGRWTRQVAGSGPVLLVGHSTGAQVALRVAVAHPAAVAGLVLAGPTFDPAARRSPVLAGRAARTYYRESPLQAALVLPGFLRAGPGGLGTLVRSALLDRPEHAVGAVRCPVLVLRGRHDRIAPEPWCRRLAAAAADGRAVTMPGAHNFPYRYGGRTALLVGRFADRLAGTGEPPPERARRDPD